MKTLVPVHPNEGDTVLYAKKLQALVCAMAESVDYWLKARYKEHSPRIAEDELPSTALRNEIRKLARRWQKQFDLAAPRLAEYFTKAANRRSSAQLKRILREGGFSVDFRMTRVLQDVMNASIAQQVSLIKSIPEKYFTDIEGAVMRSVTAGRDLSTLARDLQSTYGVSHRRAAFIARDQNNKATASITRAKQQQAGVEEAIWVHSGGGKEPRPTHQAAGRRKQRYNIAEGWYDPDADGKGKGRHIFPGELPNCRCVSRAVVPGFS